MERRARFLDTVGELEHAGEGGRVHEAAIGDRVQVREVEHGAHPWQLGRDEEDVLGSAELADAPHDLDPELHAAPFALEPLSELPELFYECIEGGSTLAAEQEPGVEDDELGAARCSDPRGVVEHADGHSVLLVALEVAEEGRDRRMH